MSGCAEPTSVVNHEVAGADYDCDWTPRPRRVAMISAGFEHTTGLNVRGVMKSWGSNEGYRGGVLTVKPGPPRNRTLQRLDYAETADAFPKTTDVSAGFTHTCAVIDEGVQCVGVDASGNAPDKLGLPYDVDGYRWYGIRNEELETRFQIAPPANLSHKFVQVAAGGHHTCAITNTGYAVCWGLNAAGQLGGLSQGRGKPVLVSLDAEGNTPLTNVRQIATGLMHTCAIVATSPENDASTLTTTMFCWGSGGSGQLGTLAGRGISLMSMDRPHLAEVFVSRGQPTFVAAGSYHTCAILRPGQGPSAHAVYCSGDNTLGQAGQELRVSATHGYVMYDDPPLAPKLITFASHIATGDKHTCVVLGDRFEGDLSSTTEPAFQHTACFGNNATAQLARDPAVLSNTHLASLVGGLPAFVSADQVAAGAGHSCTLLDDGTAHCFGANTKGQLGAGLVGNTTHVVAPKPVLRFGDL